MAEFMSKSDKDFFLRRLSGMDIERQSFINHWKELSENVDPRRGQFFSQERNKGEKRHGKIINSRGTQAHRASSAGMFAGAVSPTRRWFKFETLDPDMMNTFAVKEWAYKCENLIFAILLDSNFYASAANTLAESILFATGAMSQVDDFDHVANFYPHTVGSYYISQNDKCEVDTFVSVRDRTVKQIVDQFGLDNVSLNIKNLYDTGDYDKWYSICQFIDPNPEYNAAKADQDRSMLFRSTWFELGNISGSSSAGVTSGATITDNKFLKRGGFQEFPIHCFRWATTGDDIYGTNSPGMTALGDIKGLQLMEKRTAQALDKLINPPLQGPPSLKNVPINSLPGGVTLLDSDMNKEGVRPLYQFEPRIQEMRESMRQVEMRINEAFFVDLFMAITNMEGVQPKNQLELSQRNAERLLMLGPPLERLQQDFLGKIVQRTFKQAMRAGILPPPPPELQGQALNVSFVSALAQAQRVQEVGMIERVASFIGSLSQIKPEALDKFNSDEAIEKYSQFVGAPPSIIVPQEQADAVRQQRAQMQQQQMEAAQAQQQSQSLGNVASAAKDAAAASDVINQGSQTVGG